MKVNVELNVVHDDPIKVLKILQHEFTSGNTNMALEEAVEGVVWGVKIELQEYVP